MDNYDPTEDIMSITESDQCYIDTNNIIWITIFTAPGVGYLLNNASQSLILLQ